MIANERTVIALANIEKGAKYFKFLIWKRKDFLGYTHCQIKMELAYPIEENDWQ